VRGVVRPGTQLAGQYLNAPPPHPDPLPPAKGRAVEREQPAVSRLAWPVRGRVISGYGPKDGGTYNDGINIAAPRGTPVAAAGDGTVAYVGHSLESYGNLVLIRHGGGVVTAYAHLGAVRVKQGMIVKKGQLIGAVGATGAVTAAQLHFEVRRGGEPINPAQYL
jgi:murein DD-endopeptidase MepM/ murein hydrolase activator NlpD